MDLTPRRIVTQTRQSGEPHTCWICHRPIRPKTIAWTWSHRECRETSRRYAHEGCLVAQEGVA